MSDLTSKELTISDDGQVVTIFGIRYDIELFRHLGIAPVGARIEIIERPGDGTLTIKRLPDEPEAAPSGNELSDVRDLEIEVRELRAELADRAAQPPKVRYVEATNAAGIHGVWCVTCGARKDATHLEGCPNERDAQPPGDVKPPKFHVGQQVRATGGYAVREVKRIFYRYEVTMADQMCGQFVCLDEKELVAADSSETKGVE